MLVAQPYPLPSHLAIRTTCPINCLVFSTIERIDSFIVCNLHFFFFFINQASLYPRYPAGLALSIVLGEVLGAKCSRVHNFWYDVFSSFCHVPQARLFPRERYHSLCSSTAGCFFLQLFFPPRCSGILSRWLKVALFRRKNVPFSNG